jgi:hypothetical protein
MTENTPFPQQPDPQAPFGSAQPPAPQSGPRGPFGAEGQSLFTDNSAANRRYEDLTKPARLLASDTDLSKERESVFAEPGRNGAARNRDAAAQAERYGKKRGMSTPRKIGLGVVGFAILCGVAGYIAYENANPPIQGTVISYQVAGDSVDVTFEVDKSSGSTATCTLQALDVHADVVGSVDVQIPAGRSKNVMSYTVSTTGTPAEVEVSSCATN